MSENIIDLAKRRREVARECADQKQAALADLYESVSERLDLTLAQLYVELMDGERALGVDEGESPRQRRMHAAEVHAMLQLFFAEWSDAISSNLPKPARPTSSRRNRPTRRD